MGLSLKFLNNLRVWFFSLQYYKPTLTVFKYFFFQHLVSLLVASDMEVVLSVLGVLYVFRYFLNLSILHVDETKGSIEIVEVTTSWQYKTRSV